MKKSVGKRLLAAAVTLALAGGLLVGCGSTGEKGESAAAQSGTTEKSSDGDVTLTVWAWDVALMQLKDCAAKYQEEHPNVKFNFVEMGTDQVYKKLSTSLSTGNGIADIIQIEGDVITSYEDKFPEGFLDLSDILNSDDFVQSKINECVYNDKTHAFPWDAGPMGLFYRTDYFEQAGVDADSIKTWDDLIEAGKKVEAVCKTPGGDPVKMLPVNPQKTNLYSMIRNELGTGLFDADGEPIVNNENSIKAMEKAKQIYDSGICLDYNGWDEYEQCVVNETVACIPEAVWMIGTNPLACMADQPQRWYEAMKPLEFVVCQDIFMTPTIMALADVVLPLSTFVEHDGLVTPNFGRNQHFIGAMNKAFDNPNTKSDLEILIDMGKRLRPELWERFESVDQFFDEQLRANYDFGLEDVRAEPAKMAGYEYRKYEKGLLRPDGEPGFDTMTGMIELKSIVLENYGEGAVPYFEEPEFSHVSRPDLADEFPLYYTTGGRNISMFHSEHRQVPSMRAMHPWPLVSINPVVAEKYGIADGDWVRVTTPQGHMVQKAWLTEMVNDKFIHVEHGWWFPEQDGEAPNLYGVWKANANNLIPHESTGITGYGAPYKNGICKIERVDSLDD